MIEVLTNPNEFFEERMKGEVSLRIPVLIILISGIIGGISTFLMAGIIAEMLRGTVPPEAQGFISVMPVGGAIVAVIASLILWVVFAAIFFGISAIFKGEGEFKRTLEFVGYGYIPMIFSGIISAVLFYNFVSTAQIPVVTDPAKMTEALEPLMKSPMMQLSTVIGILFMLWSANIWIFGLKHARNLTTKNALITVAIPMAVYVLYSVWQLVSVM
ncbi:MAG: YIP1 family protein [Halobacteriota archaeon]